MKRMKRLATAIALSLSLSMSAPACSYMFVDGPRSPTKPAGCSTSKGWVVVDYIFTATNLLTALAFMSLNAEAENDESLSAPGSTPVIVNVGWAAIHTLSAISGSSKVDKCRAAYDSEDDDKNSPDHNGM